jgi:hypothetical protein
MKSDQDLIQAFVERNGFYEKPAGPHGEYYSQRDHASFDGCRMTVHALFTSTDEPPYKRETMQMDIVIDLKKMDPKAMASLKDLNGNELPVGRDWIILKTADGQEWIEMKQGDNLMSSNSVWLIQGGTNHEENQKIADAFGRLITGCQVQK